MLKQLTEEFISLGAENNATDEAKLLIQPAHFSSTQRLSTGDVRFSINIFRVNENQPMKIATNEKRK